MPRGLLAGHKRPQPAALLWLMLSDQFCTARAKDTLPCVAGGSFRYTEPADGFIAGWVIGDLPAAPTKDSVGTDFKTLDEAMLKCDQLGVAPPGCTVPAELQVGSPPLSRTFRRAGWRAAYGAWSNPHTARSLLVCSRTKHPVHAAV
jgi:hypothetical protein